MPVSSFTDQMGKTCQIDFPPKRIISLVPSQTELLHYFGLEKEVVGITKFCVHPKEWFRSKTRIGGTKNYNFEKIAALNPQLIIGNKEENEKEQIELLKNQYPVWMSDIQTVKDAFEMIEKTGQLTGKTSTAMDLSNTLQQRFSDFEQKTKGQSKKRAAYFIWKAPFMVAARDTFINEMMHIAGFENVYHDKERYPVIELEDLIRRDPEVILLSSEPYPFKEKHIDVFKKACPKANVIIADGELFSWYGSRLLYSIEYFEALHQQIW